jgi:hypothetical protein
VTPIGPRRRIDSKTKDEDFEDRKRRTVDFSDEGWLI